MIELILSVPLHLGMNQLLASAEIRKLCWTGPTLLTNIKS